MRRTFLILSTLFVTLMFSVSEKIFAQNDPVIVTIAGENVTLSEFINIYKKSNVKNEVMSKEALEEYLELFINFKLKVKEAESRGMDTVTSFIKELAGYRKQLAQPYLIDKDVNNNLLQEVYDRMQWDIRASHILIKLSNDALPKDTMLAYNRIMKIRDMIISGKAFDQLAKDSSDDISARDRATQKGNGGDLGYFTALDLVYPFETMAYKTKIGEVSMPVRTDYGYHLIKVTDRKPAMGKAQIAHILVSAPNDSAGIANEEKYRLKIFEISQKLKNDESFEDLAKSSSDDKGSALKGGVLPWFGVSRMVPEIIETISKLKKGEISEPVKTIYGWHIIKLIDQKPVDSLENIKTELKSKISRDSRALISKESMVEKLKREYLFKDDINALKDFYSVVNDSIFMGKWRLEKAKNMNKKMFTISDKVFNQQDFATYLFENQLSRPVEDSTKYLNSMYKNFIEKSILSYEDSRLETKYLEFKTLMKEYRDGILLFELTDKLVWTKAVKDTLGLQDFYEKNKTKYFWDTRVDADIFTCINAKIAKTVRQMLISGKYSDSEIIEKINKKTKGNLSVVNGKYLKNENALIDSTKWNIGIGQDIIKDNKVYFVRINRVIENEQKTIAEARGAVTSDYQTYLEKVWLASLRKKFPVVVNKEALLTIK